MANPRRRNILTRSLITENRPWNHASQMRNLPLGKPAGSPCQLSLLSGCNDSLWQGGLAYYSSSMSGTCTSFWQCGQKTWSSSTFSSSTVKTLRQSLHLRFNRMSMCIKLLDGFFEWLPANRMACGLVGRPLVMRLISFSWPLYLYAILDKIMINYQVPTNNVVFTHPQLWIVYRE